MITKNTVSLIVLHSFYDHVKNCVMEEVECEYIEREKNLQQREHDVDQKEHELEMKQK